MTDAPRLATRHSRDFVAGWRSAWRDVFRWRREGPFTVVPSLLGSPVFAYLPGLSYSDLTGAEAERMARDTQGRSFNIRLLGAPEAAEGLADGAAAVLRLNLAAVRHDVDTVWNQILTRSGRKSVRRARKAGLVASEETGAAALNTLCAMVRMALSRHGMPMLPAVLFDALVAEMGARVLVVRGADGRPLASLLWLRDGPLAWVPWSGGELRPDNPVSLLFWTLIEQALNDGADIVDFGRSAKGHGAWHFKRQFGATPVPVAWLSDKPADVYRRYRLAQRAWRALPLALTDRLGPKVCRFLPDY